MTNSRDFQDAHQLQQFGQSFAAPAAQRTAAPEISGLAALGRYVGCADHGAARPAMTSQKAISPARQGAFVEEDCDILA